MESTEEMLALLRQLTADTRAIRELLELVRAESLSALDRGQQMQEMSRRMTER